MFPQFNQYSTPLLILALQGLIFAYLLVLRYRKKHNSSDIFLALILLLTSYSQVCYTLGFMGWYDTYRNTKINYGLLNIGVALAPLIYLYVKSITTTSFKFRLKDLWHFALFFTFILYRLLIFTYDALQPGFSETQNGVLKITVDEAFVQPLIMFLEFPIVLLYLAFTLQLFYNYRKKIIHYFSNTYKLELNWILSFLVLFSLLFLYDAAQTIVGSFITDLNYQQRWWLNFFTAQVTLYVGIKGYFTDTTTLKKLDFVFSPNKDAIPEPSGGKEHKQIETSKVNKIVELMQSDKVYLDPDLNLSDMAEKAEMSRAEVSEIINSEFNQNFNEFVNGYRVKEFQQMLKEGRHEKLSFIGVAYECGFNSKATFNRVFKKVTNLSPTQYLNSQG